MANIPNRPEYQSDLFKQGLDVRRDVLGADYVDGSLTRADDFNAAFQQITTEVAWGMIWTRPGLPRKTRSMINLTMLAALNRGAEFRLHLRAALSNGVTPRRDQGDPAADRRLLRHPRLPRGVPDRHRGVQGRRRRPKGQRLMADKPSVGFVGVGNMGWPMAACLVSAGFAVHVNDSRREVANNFVQQIGGDAPDTPARNWPRRRTW